MSLVAIQGAFRKTGVGVPDAKFQTFRFQLPPGQVGVKLRSAGGAMNIKLGVEIAFRDAAGRSWLRRSDGRLEEVSGNSVDLYRLKKLLSETPR